MAECKDCNQEMLDINTESCTYRFIKIDGVWYERDTDYFDYNNKCHDCGIVNNKGNIHHLGCDVERCPACDGQLISCGCMDDNTWELSVDPPSGEVIMRGYLDAEDEPTKDARTNVTTRQDPKDKFVRTAIQPMSAGGCSIDILTPKGEFFARINIFVREDGSWGDVDVVIDPETQQGTFLAWQDGKQVINHQGPEGSVVYAVDIKRKE